MEYRRRHTWEKKMRYELYVYLTKSKFWFKVLQTSDQRFFDYKKRKLVKDGHQVKESVNYIGA
jgi:hypothetical protein